MRKTFFFLLITLIVSCGRKGPESENSIITVSIAPFRYFVEEIGGNDFTVNIMVPPGADPHIYEPFPEQIIKLRKSVAYISNGYLGFEMNWLSRFYESNPTMKKLCLGDKIDLLSSVHHGDSGHLEGADPHYWTSPRCALIIASSVKDLLTGLKPAEKEKYESNYQKLVIKIQDVDEIGKEALSVSNSRSFMIYHPTLAYLARDYGLEEIPVEFEGKEPSPSRMRELIDLARKDHFKSIFVMREYDTKNAMAIAGEIGANLVTIDPLSENWQKSTTEIIEALHKSLKESSN